MFNHYFKKALIGPIAVTVFTYGLMSGNVTAAEDEKQAVAFPDKFMIRLGTYIIDGSDTQFSVNSDVAGLGTVIDFNRDLGGDTRDTVPRIDAYYRFNERHRINFTSFAIDRKGSRVLAIDPPIIIDGEDFSGGTINSEIKYNLYKLGYGYSFYHSSKVELSLAAGLHVVSYDLKFSDTVGNKIESVDVSAPLPMFGMHIGYAITPKWSVQYVSEAFFIELENAIKGALVSYELNTEYRLFKNLSIGAGFARRNINIEVNDNNWNGKVSDSYRGYTIFGAFYF